MSASQENTTQNLATQKSLDPLAVIIRLEPGPVVTTTLTSAAASASTSSSFRLTSASASTSSSFPFTSASAPGSTARTAASSSASYPTSSASSSSPAVVQSNSNGNQQSKKASRPIHDIMALKNISKEKFKAIKKQAKEGDLVATTELGLCCHLGILIDIDRERSFINFKLAADQNYAPAQYYIAEYYYKDETSDNFDLKEAFKSIKSAAVQNYKPALTALAYYYRNGIGVRKTLDPKWATIGKEKLQVLSREEFHKAQKEADSGNPIKQAEVGFCLLNTYSNSARRIKHHKLLTFHYCELAAEQGYDLGQYHLGTLYYMPSLKQNFELAATLYHLAADQGLACAQYCLGLLYESGQGVKQSETQAIHYFKLAADQGYVPAQEALTKFPTNNTKAIISSSASSSAPAMSASASVSSASATASASASSSSHSNTQANQAAQKQIQVIRPLRRIEALKNITIVELDAIKKAALNYDEVAATELGLCYREGINDSSILKQDPNQACRYFQIATHKNYAPGQLYFAECYLKGTGVKQDNKNALKYTKLSAAQNYEPALIALANYYNNGIGTLKQLDQKWANLKEGRDIKELLELNPEQVKTLKQEANSGNPVAQFELGICHLYDIKVGKDDKKAFENFTLAAEQGFAPGQTNLARFYKEGIGVKQNYVLAATLFRLATNQGNGAAQHEMGQLYLEGKGLPKNEQRALHYIKLSAAQNYAPGLMALGQCFYKGIGILKQLDQKWSGLGQARGINDLQQLSFDQIKALKKEADSGNPKAQTEISTCYHVGIKVTEDEVIKNDKKAFEYALSAAEQGYFCAQKMLGPYCHDIGTMINNSLIRQVLYLLAAEQQSKEPITMTLGNLLKIYNIGQNEIENNSLRKEVQDLKKSLQASNAEVQALKQKLQSLNATVTTTTTVTNGSATTMPITQIATASASASASASSASASASSQTALITSPSNRVQGRVQGTKINKDLRRFESIKTPASARQQQNSEGSNSVQSTTSEQQQNSEGSNKRARLARIN